MGKDLLQIIRITAIILSLQANGFSQTTFLNSPGSVQNQPFSYCVPCSGAKWINTNNLVSVDSQFTSLTLQPASFCYQDQCYWSRYLDCYNFGFSIPSDAMIKGIKVDVKKEFHLSV